MKVERLVMGTLDDATGLALFVEALLLVVRLIARMFTVTEAREKEYGLSVVLLGECSKACLDVLEVPFGAVHVGLAIVERVLCSTKTIVTSAILAVFLQACVTFA